MLLWAPCWRNTKVCLNRGIIQPQNLNFPTELWEYMQEKASNVNILNKTISVKQSQKIKKSYLQNLDKASQSETFNALQNDVKLFGINKVFSNDLYNDEEP